MLSPNLVISPTPPPPPSGPKRVISYARALFRRVCAGTWMRTRNTVIDPTPPPKPTGPKVTTDEPGSKTDETESNTDKPELTTAWFKTTG